MYIMRPSAYSCATITLIFDLLKWKLPNRLLFLGERSISVFALFCFRVWSSYKTDRRTARRALRLIRRPRIINKTRINFKFIPTSHYRKWKALLPSYVFIRINCNFVTTVGLTNDERCLIHTQSACGETPGFLKSTKMFSNKLFTLKLWIVSGKC